MKWSAPEMMPQEGKRTRVEVKTAILPEHYHRFHLYQTPDMARRVKTMWVLWDEKTGAQHYLCGDGWEGAEQAAAQRIGEILGKESNPDEAVPRPRKARPRRRNPQGEPHRR